MNISTRLLTLLLLLVDIICVSSIAICTAQIQPNSLTNQVNTDINCSFDNRITRIRVIDKNSNALIDLPVAQGNIDYWLKHSINHLPSISGTPVVDTKCNGIYAQNILIYGHRIGRDGVFGPISNVYNQTNLNNIDRIELDTTAQKTITFIPIAGLKVKSDFASIQKIGFDSTEQMHNWQKDLCLNAQAHIPNADEEIESSYKTLSLVTCSEAQPNQPWRCILVAVARNTEQDCN